MPQLWVPVTSPTIHPYQCTRLLLSGQVTCHVFLSTPLGSVLETPDTERTDTPHHTPSSSCHVFLCTHSLDGNPGLSCCGACVSSHTITRLGCENILEAEWMPCSDHEEMGFACLSLTSLLLTADGFTTRFRKLYLKEMKNRQLLELTQPSVGSPVLHRRCLFLCGSRMVPIDWPWTSPDKQIPF